MDKEDFKEGTIVNVYDGFIWVTIEQKSACSGCHAKGYCASTDCKDRILKFRIKNNEHLNIGDRVNVFVSDKVGFVSVFIAFVLPILIVVGAVLFAPSCWESKYLALFILFIIGAYYLAVYIFREKINGLVKIDYIRIANDLR